MRRGSKRKKNKEIDNESDLNSINQIEEDGSTSTLQGSSKGGASTQKGQESIQMNLIQDL